MLFGMFTGLVNAIAYFLARGTRKLFGIQGTWHFGASASTVGIGLGKFGTEFCFFAALFLYCVLYPTIGNIAQFFAVATFIAVLAVWMPSVFFFGLFVGTLEET